MNIWRYMYIYVEIIYLLRILLRFIIVFIYIVLIIVHKQIYHRLVRRGCLYGLRVRLDMFGSFFSVYILFECSIKYYSWNKTFKPHFSSNEGVLWCGSATFSRWSITASFPPSNNLRRRRSYQSPSDSFDTPIDLLDLASSNFIILIPDGNPLNVE